MTIVTPPANVSWVPLDFQHGPCSSSDSNAAAPAGVQPSLVDLLRQDQLRADDVQRRLRSPNSTYDESKGQAGTSGETDTSYQAKVRAQWGSRTRNRPTNEKQQGSQTDTFYDPTNSGTYAAFPCNSPACRQLGPYANGCINNQCQYRVTYPDGSSTSGTYSSDLLTLNPTTRVSKFQFGCSHVDQGNFDTQTAGIMALGGGPESLASQTAATYGSVFAYCLPPTASYLGFFVLGARAWRRRGSWSRMSTYRMAAPKGILDTCYDFTGVRSVKVPRIALVFDRNAAVELDPSGILFNGCLAFAANADDRMAGILGNVQQQTIEVVYDVGGGAVGFRRNAC
ncbi:unnamed protein product [Miscanthus lutarioriparius]|uniref:Peptidase A1 domain-containing protein n=1 Tax=Miscanthus lutarioriparius TaxID=422564 RepID=A0A811S8V8_9POAL|nr:unnamed protein product [Miscanthus lutarioriparius]